MDAFRREVGMLYPDCFYRDTVAVDGWTLKVFSEGLKADFGRMRFSAEVRQEDEVKGRR